MSTTHAIYNGAIPFQPLKEFGEPIQQAAMPIVAKVDNKLLPARTGFVITNSGLMLTAAQVLNYFERSRGGRALSKEGNYEHEGKLYAIDSSSERHGPNNEHHLGGLLPIVRIWYPEGIGIGLCWLSLPSFDGKRLPLKVMPLRNHLKSRLAWCRVESR